MGKQLEIQWGEVERAALAGVPMYEIATKLVESTASLKQGGVERLYATIRKRASRERWPLPEAGVAGDGKQANQWRKGEDGLNAIAESKRLMGVSVPRSSENDNVEQMSPIAREGAEIVRDCAGEALLTAPPTATELVTADLAALGSRGLRAILSRATEAAEAMQAAPEIRSWNDVQVMTKVISQAAGLDKPAVSVAVSLNNGANASITAWECVDSV